MVNEGVRVGKRAVQRTENVSDNVRHEELRGDFIPPDKADYQRNQKLEGRSRPIPLRRHSGDKSPFTD